MSATEQISIDSVKAYWNARPCNIRHSLKPIGTRDYFDEVEARKYLVEPHIPGFAEFLRWKEKRVLELGCGIGTDTMNFARAGARVAAVDLSLKSLEVAAQRARVFGLSDRITFHNADGEELSKVLPVEPYDLVYSFGVIHHTPHPERAVAELRRYLKPGGTLKVMVYYRYSWKVLWILLGHGRGRFWRLKRLVATHSEAQTGCPVTFVYGKAEARRLIESGGFKVTRMAVDHVFPYCIDDYVQYRYVKTWYFRLLPKWLFRNFERVFGWHLLLEAEAL